MSLFYQLLDLGGCRIHKRSHNDTFLVSQMRMTPSHDTEPFDKKTLAQMWEAHNSAQWADPTALYFDYLNPSKPVPSGLNCVPNPPMKLFGAAIERLRAIA
jgi:hypothetical protein